VIWLGTTWAGGFDRGLISSVWSVFFHLSFPPRSFMMTSFLLHPLSSFLKGENASGRLPHLRYSCLSDKLCERGWFGQKTSRGWYLYDPAAPRKPLENPDTLQLIRDHRSTMVSPPPPLPLSNVNHPNFYSVPPTCCLLLCIIRDNQGTTERQVSDQEVVERTLYAMVNEGYRILEEGIAAGPADIDVVYVYGYGFPRYRGGPM
jgi:3-hydroxyacyl-CoA dehydrogenase